MNDDLISRQALLDKFKPWLEVKGYSEGEQNMLKAVLYEIQEFPSKVPERKKGKWTNDGKGFYKCTSCDEPWPHWWAVVVPPDRMYKELRFCPKCGAWMKGVKEA